MAKNKAKMNKFLTGAITATMVASAVAPLASAASFTDTDKVGDKVKAEIDKAVELGFFIDAEKFNPANTLNRSQAALTLARYISGTSDLKSYVETKELEKSVTPFKDVPASLKDGAAYQAELYYASLIVKNAGAFTQETLNPTGELTRSQMAKVITEAFELTKPADFKSKVTDIAHLDATTKNYIETLEANGVTDVTDFRPAGQVTRSQMASFLVRAYDAVHVEAGIVSATAINKTTVEVKFSTNVDEVSASNFAIEGATVSTAKLGEDKKTVTLTVSGLEYDKEYKVAATKVLVDGEETDFGSKTFKTPAVSDLWNLVVEPAASELNANGADNTKVTFKLVDKATGQPDPNADNIVLSVKTTYGALANDRITIQDGVADVLLTSEFSNKNITAKIDAQIIEASGDYNELIGKVFGTAEVKFTVQDATVETKTLVAAESNQADRVTLFFDQNVALTDFVKVDSFGNLLYNYDSNGDGKVEVDAQGKAIEVTADHDILKTATPYHALKNESVKVSQGTKGFLVQGVRPVNGNAKAMEVILANPNKIGTQLTDNEKVSVETNINNSIDQITKSTANFVLTDARNPEVTSAKAQGMNQVVLKFSESVADGDIRIDGLASSDNSLKNKSAVENIVKLGEFNAVTLQDTRDTATIDLTDKYDWDGPSKDKAIPGYFKAGQHSIQISNLVDHAFATDSKNKGTTQTLQFVVEDDTKRPSIAAKTESPEQFRVSFDRQLRQNNDQVKGAIQLQIFDEKSKEWYNVDGTGKNGKHPDVKVAATTSVDHVAGGQYVVETTTDWTKVFDTENTNNNYYNYKFRLFVDKEKVSNKANGLVNEEALIADLSASGSHLLANDTTSPVIEDIKATLSNSTYRVLMSEPVKLPGLDNAGDTLNQDQDKLPAPTVQFQGKDKDGKTVTFSGVVNGYSDLTTTKADSEFFVRWSANEKGETPQDIVDAGGSTKWTVIVKAISDDVGNTAATLTKDFDIDKTPERIADFQIIAAHQDGVNDTAKADRIILTFTSGVAHTGGSNDATALSQYTLNGKTLPTGTSIAVENRDAVEGNETVIITLPNGYLEETNTITVNKNLVSGKGVKLTGQYEWVAVNGTGLDPVEPNPGQGLVLKNLPADAWEIQDNTDVDKWGVVLNYDKLPAELQGAESYTITIDGVKYELTKNQFNSNKFNGNVDSTKHTKAEVEAGVIEKVVAPSAVLGELAADAWEIQDNTDVDKWGVVLNHDKLPTALQGATSYVITIDGATYELTKNQFNPSKFNGNADSTKHTKAEVEKGIITKK